MLCYRGGTEPGNILLGLLFQSGKVGEASWPPARCGGARYRHLPPARRLHTPPGESCLHPPSPEQVYIPCNCGGGLISLTACHVTNCPSNHLRSPMTLDSLDLDIFEV